MACMIRVKMFGVLRLNTGISSVSMEAKTVGDLIDQIAGSGKADRKELRKCAVFVAGKPAKMQTRLHDEDEVVFLSPAGGG